MNEVFLFYMDIIFVKGWYLVGAGEGLGFSGSTSVSVMMAVLLLLLLPKPPKPGDFFPRSASLRACCSSFAFRLISAFASRSWV